MKRMTEKGLQLGNKIHLQGMLIAIPIIILSYLRFNWYDAFPECSVICTMAPWYCYIVPAIIDGLGLAALLAIMSFTIYLFIGTMFKKKRDKE